MRGARILKGAVYPATLEKSATACIASRNSLSNLKRFTSRFRVRIVDRHVEEEAVDRRAQRGQRPHRALEILGGRVLAGGRAGGAERRRRGPFLRRSRARRHMLPAKASAPSFFSSARRMLAARR